jgi:hypothetical protein
MSDLTRLTIIVADKAVYKNTEGYSDLDFSNCEIPGDVWAFQWENGEGWIEFKDSRENEPFVGTDFPAWVNNCTQKFDEFDVIHKAPPSPPTPEQLAEMNDAQAKFLLQDSDWAALPDTNLQNQSEWDAYRAALRAIVVNPPQEEITLWPVKPEAIWV